MSPAQLREGAEQIAAACTFSGHPYVLVTQDASMDSAISPADALPDWTPLEHRRLLGTAIFDEGTYGRVRFYHRAVREYLAACWVEHRLRDGLPLAHALKLFIQAPYGNEVLLKNRRAVLCWLASLNAQVRERVIRQFPEMLMFEGDPQCWSTDDVFEAFKGYLQKLETGYRRDWFNTASELRRVARMLPPGFLAGSLSQYSKSSEVLYELLTLINHGKVASCADAVFALYCDPERSDQDRSYALITLASVAKPDQRQAIAADLVSGRLQSDELIATAFRVVGLQSLTVAELTAILRHAQPESDFGGGQTEMAIKNDLLPAADFHALQKLLTALLCALPGDLAKELAYRRSAAGPSREGWLLSVLPDCFRRGVDLLGDDGTDAPQALVDAALVAGNLQYSVYVNNEDYQALRVAIGKHPGFRLRIARAIACSADVGLAVTRLTRRGLVGFSREDLDWLLREARREDIDAAERQVWYEVARNIAFSLRGKLRRQALTALTAGVDGPARTDDIKTYRAQQIESIQTNRGWKRDERAQKAEKRRQLEESKTQLLKEIDVIRDGSGFSAMQWLISYTAEASGPIRYTKVSLEPIVYDFGHELAEAFSDGMTKVWQYITVPNPADYPANRVPWVGLIGLASVNHAFAKGLDVQNLSVKDITRAVQFCIWEIERPEAWLDALVESRADTVTAALMPWFEGELGLTTGQERSLRTVDFVLRASPALQGPFLQRAVEWIRDGKISDERLRLRLFRALTEAGASSKEFVAEIASRRLLASTDAEHPVFALDWFVPWTEVDLPAAWSWLVTHKTTFGQDDAEVAGLVAEALNHAQWTKGLSGTEAEATALVSLFRFLSVYAEASPPEPDAYEGPVLSHPIRRVRDGIPRILASMPGKAAHAALQELAGENAGMARGNWLQGLILEQEPLDKQDSCYLILSCTSRPHFAALRLAAPLGGGMPRDARAAAIAASRRRRRAAGAAGRKGRCFSGTFQILVDSLPETSGDTRAVGNKTVNYF